MKKPPKPMKPVAKPPFPPKKGAAEPDADDKMVKQTRPGQFGPIKKVGF